MKKTYEGYGNSHHYAEPITMEIKLPKWIADARKKRLARERYFLNRYGNLDRMNAIEARFQYKMDELAMDDELCGGEK